MLMMPPYAAAMPPCLRCRSFYRPHDAAADAFAGAAAAAFDFDAAAFAIDDASPLFLCFHTFLFSLLLIYFDDAAADYALRRHALMPRVCRRFSC